MKKFRNVEIGGAVLLLLIISPQSVTVAPTGLVQPVGVPAPIRLSVEKAREDVSDRLLRSGAVRAGPAKPNTAIPSRLDQTYGKLPLAFEVNRGQTDASVGFISRGPGSSLFLSSTEAVLVLTKPETRARPDKPALGRPDRARSENVTQTIVRMKLISAKRRVERGGTGRTAREGQLLHRQRSNEVAHQHSDVRANRYRDVYPGVNLVYHGNLRQLEYRLCRAAGSRPGPNRARLRRRP